MKRNYLIELLKILISVGGYTSYELLNDNEKGGSTNTNTFKIVIDIITTEVFPDESISVFSFSIQFLRQFIRKIMKAWLNLLKDYDIVAIQELNLIETINNNN